MTCDTNNLQYLTTFTNIYNPPGSPWVNKARLFSQSSRGNALDIGPKGELIAAPYDRTATPYWSVYGGGNLLSTGRAGIYSPKESEVVDPCNNPTYSGGAGHNNGSSYCNQPNSHTTDNCQIDIGALRFNGKTGYQTTSYFSCDESCQNMTNGQLPFTTYCEYFSGGDFPKAYAQAVPNYLGIQCTGEQDAETCEVVIDSSSGVNTTLLDECNMAQCCMNVVQYDPASQALCGTDYYIGSASCTNFVAQTCLGRLSNPKDPFNPECVDFYKNYEGGDSDIVTALLVQELNDIGRLVHVYNGNFADFNPDTDTPEGKYASGNTAGIAFLQTTIPTICNLCPSACGKVLDGYCAQYTSDDLVGLGRFPYDDALILQRLCGCHLVSQTSETCPDIEFTLKGGTQVSLNMDPNSLGMGQRCQTTSQYLTDTTECEPVCSFADTIAQGTYNTTTNQCESTLCQSTVCVIDQFIVNQINSNGKVVISQNCGGSEGKGDCYIDQSTINMINSTGGAVIEQSCTSCYSFDPAHGTATGTCVHCSSLGTPCTSPAPSPNNNPTSPSSVGDWFVQKYTSIKTWLIENKKFALYITGFAILFLIIVIVICIHKLFQAKKQKVEDDE